MAKNSGLINQIVFDTAVEAQLDSCKKKLKYFNVKVSRSGALMLY